MSELEGLYQELIVDHSRRPQNFGPLPGANRSIEGYNPLCGDHFTVHLVVEGGVVQRAAFEGTGCAISTASASMMTEAVRGLQVPQAEALFEQVHALITGEQGAPDPEDLGRLGAFAGVRNFPARVKCASLAWHALKAALHGETEPVSTE